MADTDTDAIRRALTFWRARHAPTYAGLRQLRRVAARQPESSTVLLDAAKRKLSSFPLTARHHLIFKDLGPRARPEYRDCTGFSPWSALVEAAALAAVAPTAVATPHDCVFSYRLSRSENRSPFKYFLDGYTERLERISRRVRSDTELMVVVSDIRNFYPSIQARLARDAAEQLASQSAPYVRDYLLQFLAFTGTGLPVGPATSHVLANIVLAGFDERMSQAFPGNYFRYVDDLVIVVRPSEVKAAVDRLRSELAELGLEPHPDKTAELTAAQWLSAAPILSETVTWDGHNANFDDLVHLMRAFLDAGGERAQLRSVLDANGLQLSPLASTSKPMPSLLLRAQAAVFGRFPSLAAAFGLDPRAVLRQMMDLARTLRIEYAQRLESLSAEPVFAGPLARWRLQRTLRIAGRLALLMPTSELPRLKRMLPQHNATHIFRTIIDALVEHRPGMLLPYPGGPVRQLAFLWRMHRLRVIDSDFAIRTSAYLESALELVVRGIITPNTPRIEVDIAGQRLAQSLLREVPHRTLPDLSLEDEMESLYLRTPVARRFARVSDDDDLDDQDDPLS